MGKYADLETDIYNIFTTAGPTGWLITGIKTFPANFECPDQLTKFIRVAILPSSDGLNIKSVSGLIMIDIFTSAGHGTKDAFEIADKLDDHLVGKTLSVGNTSTQCGNSVVQLEGLDKDNPALFRTTYSIPFNHYGVN